MKNALWFVLGTAFGFVIAHVVNKDPRGHEVLAEIDARIAEFTDRMSDAYREQQARLADELESVTDRSALSADARAE